MLLTKKLTVLLVPVIAATTLVTDAAYGQSIRTTLSSANSYLSANKYGQEFTDDKGTTSDYHLFAQGMNYRYLITS